MVLEQLLSRGGGGARQMVLSTPDFHHLQQNLDDQEKVRCNLEIAL